MPPSVKPAITPPEKKFRHWESVTFFALYRHSLRSYAYIQQLQRWSFVSCSTAAKQSNKKKKTLDQEKSTSTVYLYQVCTFTVSSTKLVEYSSNQTARRGNGEHEPFTCSVDFVFFLSTKNSTTVPDWLCAWSGDTLLLGPPHGTRHAAR